ncbi:hypothetical protein Naga_100030g1 [Nannochloropsis gaditana]|uniref:Uncharacterized protein n=1 Tax=Nannochloropsis gaditana TaxID=72520 RepID=W7TBL1_9STRA|nr:hypothetical protein Naga_100030g1 [Nannochloropsis gaditana]
MVVPQDMQGPRRLRSSPTRTITLYTALLLLGGVEGSEMHGTVGGGWSLHSAGGGVDLSRVILSFLQLLRAALDHRVRKPSPRLSCTLHYALLLPASMHPLSHRIPSI